MRLNYRTDKMSDKILITFSSKYGSTAEIAGKINEIILEAGFETSLLPVDQVKNVSEYKAVILGSAVYIGRWRKKAKKFLKANEKILADKPVWIFSSGPTGEGDPVELLDGWKYPKSLQAVISNIKPRNITLFHGAVITSKLSGLHKWMANKVEAPVGDFRDWNAMTGWAKGIVTELQ